MSIKKCSNCGIDKETNPLYFRVRKYKNGKEFFNSQCRLCESLKTTLYNKNNINKRKEYQKQWRKDHPNHKREYNCKNIEYIREYRREYEKRTEIKLRRLIADRVRDALKKNKMSKNNASILPYLSYTIKDLKQHLESKFEPWMTWQNHTIYDYKKWDDSDSTTWTWNIDHIIPQSKLAYSSMKEDNFKKCWSLENLRPLSAKQNVIDGARR